MSGPGKILQHIAMDSSGQNPHSLQQRSLPTGSGAKFWTLRPPVLKRGWKIPHVRWSSTQTKSHKNFAGVRGNPSHFDYWRFHELVSLPSCGVPLFQQTLPFPSPLVVLPKLSSASAFNFGISWLSEDEIRNIQTQKGGARSENCVFLLPL